MKLSSPAASWPQSEAELLSPPSDPLENWRWRAQLTNLWMRQPEVISNLLSISAKDLIWTFLALLFTKDPRCNPSERPFVLYPHERSLVDQLEQHLRDGKDLLIEKSRDMGCSWTVLGWLLWHWRFDESFHAIIGSRLEDLIDEKGNLDTHFERFRWLCRNLPSWWLPHRFDEARHLGMAFSETRHIPYMRLMRPDSDNTIVGEAVTEDFSRQGRYRVAFMDEFASCEHAEGAWTATADSAPMRLVVSTPHGLGNKFAQIRRSGTIDVLSLHWSRHPGKSKGLYCSTHGKPAPTSCTWPTCSLRSPWYDAECVRREATEIAQELDIDYLGAGHPYFDLQALERQRPEEPWATGFLVEVDLGVEFRAAQDGPWSIWELPPPKPPMSTIPLIRCVVGADVAEGLPGGDWSVAVVRDGKNRGLKAAIRTHMDTDQFAHELIKVGRFYHQAVILCERNGPGFAVNVDLVRAYGNVWHERAVEKEGMPITKRYGWPTNARTKELMLTQLREEIRTGASALRDGRLIEECKTVIVDEEGKVHADAGYHDDMVMAMAIGGMGINLLQTMKPVRQPRLAPEPQTSNLAG